MLQEQMTIVLTEIRHKLLHLFFRGRGEIELEFDDITHSCFSLSAPAGRRNVT